MKSMAIAALAATMLASGCASTGQQLAYDPEGCTLDSVAPSGSTSGPLAMSTVRSGDPAYRTKANCTSNRALAQMNAARVNQQSSMAISFPPETPN